METITSRKNSRVQVLRALGRNKAYRREQALFLCDGEKLLSEALANGADIAEIYLRGAKPAGNMPEVPVYSLSEDVFDFASPLEHSPGPLFTVRAKPLPERVRPDRVIVLENVQDPGNVGTVLRTAAALGTGSFPLLAHMSDKDIEMQTFGPVSFTPVDEQTRYFDFGHAVYTDAASGKSIEISGLELTPFGAVWKVRYEGAEAIHSPNGDPAEAEVWSMLEDKVCIESQLFFSDGSAFSTGGALTAPYTNGAVELHCEWGSAINIDGIQKIVLGDLVLWKNDP